MNYESASLKSIVYNHNLSCFSLPFRASYPDLAEPRRSDGNEWRESGI